MSIMDIMFEKDVSVGLSSLQPLKKLEKLDLK